MFSAIAMIAFSVGSMATTNEINKLSKEETECSLKMEVQGKVKPVLVRNHETCFNERVTAYNNARQEGATHEQAQAIGYQAYFRCMRNTSLD